ncbi:hypothetical protein FLA_2562 [Filimonas lacunae]|nr:hypothetical protein FLA_2562 [Filimonas lacunae]
MAGFLLTAIPPVSVAQAQYFTALSAFDYQLSAKQFPFNKVC